MNRRAANRLAILSPREQQILLLRERGLAVKEVADRVGISVNTTKTHLKHILAKLRCLSAVQAIYALRPAVCRNCPHNLAGTLRRRPRAL